MKQVKANASGTESAGDKTTDAHTQAKLRGKRRSIVSEGGGKRERERDRERERERERGRKREGQAKH